MFSSVITKKRGGGDTPMHTMDSLSTFMAQKNRRSTVHLEQNLDLHQVHHSHHTTKVFAIFVKIIQVGDMSH